MNLLETMRNVTTLDGEIPVYKNAKIELRQFCAEEVSPIAKYVLTPHLDKLRVIRSSMILKAGLDILNLDEIVDNHLTRIAPPVIEYSKPDDAFVIVDGIHRFYLAKSLKLPIRAIVVSGANPEYPVISLPINWSEVRECESRPKSSSERRDYREGISEDCINNYYRDLSFLGSSGRRFSSTGCTDEFKGGN